MAIVSVKGAELSPDSWKLKARIVFRGDNIRDECRMSAVFDELYSSSPSSLEGLNTTIAFGLLDSHGVSVSDAIKAYVQSVLKSPTHTYVTLPPELIPDDKKHIKDPCARLYKALYGHPLSSASWTLHLDSILKGLGGQEFPNLPSVCFFPHLSLVLCVYVDDLTLSGPTIQHEDFWRSLSKQVDLEPFTPLGRVLGRSHRFVLYKGVKALALETEDFARRCVDLYEALSGKAVKHFQTPHADPGSLVVSDAVPRGELSASAARMVMKLLWLAHLSRPDILVAVTLLAAKVATWSTNEDRVVARLVGYVSYSAHYSSIWFIGDASQSPSLSLYVDSDFGGCLHSARSTSGYVLALEGPASCPALLELEASEGCFTIFD